MVTAVVLFSLLILLSTPQKSAAGVLKFDDDDGVHKNSGVPCEEIYVVGEGETLQTISAKCSDPFILEENTHVNDHDDVFPGLVLRITPVTSSSSRLTT